MCDYPWPVDAKSNKFNIRWRYVGEESPTSPLVGLDLELKRHLSLYLEDTVFGDTTYCVRVAYQDAGYPGRPMSDEEIKRWYASPESLRDAAVARLSDMRKRAATVVKSRRGVRALNTESYRGASNRGRHRSQFLLATLRPAPRPSNRPLSDEEEEKLIEKAHATIDDRIVFIREHYRDLHAALLNTFPLIKAFD
jgi:hypothetical protein